MTRRASPVGVPGIPDLDAYVADWWWRHAPRDAAGAEVVRRICGELSLAVPGWARVRGRRKRRAR